MSTKYKNSLDNQELAKFNALADSWWQLEGPFKPLHRMNPVRLNCINDHINLTGKRVVDVGCGGGILSEAMARRGAYVTGIDLAEQTLAVASEHARQQGLDIDYKNTSCENLAKQQPNSFDLVTCLEMLEHVVNPSSVVEACSQLVRPGGLVVFSTINRNLKSFLLAIVGAEYVLKLLPKGTHSYSSLIRPCELISWVENFRLSVIDSVGLLYNPLTGAFTTGQDVSVNYMLITKPKLSYG